jgi:hypothetical protein
MGEIVRRGLGAFCALMLAAAVAAPAQAALMFNNGDAIPGSGGPDLTTHFVADDFSLAQDASITGGTFTYGTGGSIRAPGPMHYFIYENTQNQGGYDLPGTVLQSGLLDVTDFTAINNPGLITHILATFTLDMPLSAQAGAHYWFGLHSDAPEPTSWAASNFFSPTRTFEQSIFDPPPRPWFSTDPEWSFTLTGDLPAPPPAAVPEPAAWAAMLLGLGGLGAALRSRRAERFSAASR